VHDVIQAHVGDAFDLAFTPDGRRLASVSGDQALKLWNVSDGTKQREFLQSKSRLQAIAISPDATLLVAGGGSPDEREGPAELAVYHSRTGERLHVLEGHTGTVLASEFSPDGRWLASSDINGGIRLWDVATGRLVKGVAAHEGVVMHLAFLPDGKTFASSGGADGTVKLWTIPELECRSTLASPVKKSIGALAVSPDGRTIAAAGGGKDTSIVLWDIPRERPRGVLRGHSDFVLTLDFSPDGRRLASGGADSMIKIWDLETEMEVITLRDHWEWIWCVKFSPDGRTLASSCSNGLIRLHRATSPSEVQSGS
jgi:WD40 repeat protein